MSWEIKPVKNGYLLRIPKTNKMQEGYFEETFFKDFSEVWDEVGKQIIDDDKDSCIVNIETSLP